MSLRAFRHLRLPCPMPPDRDIAKPDPKLERPQLLVLQFERLHQTMPSVQPKYRTRTPQSYHRSALVGSIHLRPPSTRVSRNCCHGAQHPHRNLWNQKTVFWAKDKNPPFNMNYNTRFFFATD